jgi:hypothetical protein
MAVGPTHLRVRPAPATPSQWVKRTGHEGDNSLIYLLPNLRMSGAASSPPPPPHFVAFVTCMWTNLLYSYISLEAVER